MENNEKLLTDEQLDAIWKELLKPNSRKPLTLEELRGMDGKPVWVHVVDHTVFADEKDDFDGYGLVRKSWVRVWDEKRADLIHVDYDFCGYGKEWLAYAYEPSRLDRSAWTAEWIWPSNKFNLPKCSKCGCNSKDATYGHKDNFCPKCGRAMNDAAWDMLERRLAGRSGGGAR